MSEPLLDDGENAWPLDRPRKVGRGPAHYLILLGLCISSAAIVLFAILLEPDPRGFGTHEQLGFEPCEMLQSTGVPCPACGITTAVTLAAQGDVWLALRTQPMGPLLVILVPVLTASALLAHLRGEDVYRRYRQRKLPWLRACLLVSLASWAYRAWV